MNPTSSYAPTDRPLESLGISAAEERAYVALLDHPELVVPLAGRDEQRQAADARQEPHRQRRRQDERADERAQDEQRRDRHDVDDHDPLEPERVGQREREVAPERGGDLFRSGALSQRLGLPAPDPEHDRVMICGNPAMTRELTHHLKDTGWTLTNHRGIGNFTTEVAFVVHHE